MSTEVTLKDQPIKSLIKSDAMKQQFALALPAHVSPDRFVRMAMTAILRNPAIERCDKTSVMNCLLDLAGLGLEVDDRRAHIVPFKDKATLIIGYKGLVELVRRSGDVSKIHSDVVCENDIFVHSMGEIKEHTYDLKKDRGEPYAAYSQVTLKDGTVQCEIMQASEIEKIRNNARSGNSDAWKNNKAEMYKKTVFRRLCKWLTLSPEIRDGIEKVDRHEFGETYGEVSADPAPPKAPMPRREKPAEKVDDIVTAEVVEDNKSENDDDKSKSEFGF